jgi:tRNA threonylcarbamoyladenosine biosynthesis protein TsaE
MILEKQVASQLESEAFAETLAGVLAAGDMIALEGGLGAGKTTLVRALIRALLCDPEAEVPSPTFTLIQTYNAEKFEIWHADLYRLGDEEEVYELGLDEARLHSLCLIEWPDRLPASWQADALKITLTDVPDAVDARVIQLTGGQEWQDRLQGLSQ